MAEPAFDSMNLNLGQSFKAACPSITKTFPVWKRRPLMFQEPAFSGLVMLQPSKQYQADGPKITNEFPCLRFQLHLSCHSPLSQQSSPFLTCLLAVAGVI